MIEEAVNPECPWCVLDLFPNLGYCIMSKEAHCLDCHSDHCVPSHYESSTGAYTEMTILMKKWDVLKAAEEKE